MFWSIFTIEQSKLFKRRMFWVELSLISLVALGLPVFFYLALLAETASSNVSVEGSITLQQLATWPGSILPGLSMAAGNSFGGLLIVILVAAIGGQEYTWRTLQLWLSRGVSRPSLLAARFTALLLPAFLLVLVPVLLGTGITAVFSQQLLGYLPVQEIVWVEFGLSLFRTTFTLLPYAALAFFLAIATRSPVAAVSIGLAYTLVLESILIQLLTLARGVWADLAHYLPGGLAQNLASLSGNISPNSPVAALATPTVSATTAVAGIALYTLIFLAGAFVIFRRQDLGG